MADEEQTEITASSADSLRWPDPTRPIINYQPPQAGGDGYGSPGQSGPSYTTERADRRVPPSRPRVFVIAVWILVLLLALGIVYLLWWR